MSNDPDTQVRLRLYNKMNKLFERERVCPGDILISLAVALAHSAHESELSDELMEEILNLSRSHFQQLKNN